MAIPGNFFRAYYAQCLGKVGCHADAYGDSQKVRSGCCKCCGCCICGCSCSRSCSCRFLFSLIISQCVSVYFMNFNMNLHLACSFPSIHDQVRFDAVDRGGILPYSGHSCYRCVASMAATALSTTTTGASSTMDSTETSADSSSAWLAFQKPAVMNDTSFAHSQVWQGWWSVMEEVEGKGL